MNYTSVALARAFTACGNTKDTDNSCISIVTSAVDDIHCVFAPDQPNELFRTLADIRPVFVQWQSCILMNVRFLSSIGMVHSIPPIEVIYCDILISRCVFV